MAHVFPVHVYYEDTDLAGIVYYANYLKYIERGRSEWVRAHGMDQRRLKDEIGLVFAVRRLEADYLRPARFDDALTVHTAPAPDAKPSPARVELDQEVRRGDEVLFRARVTLVALNAAGAATRIPEDLRRVLQNRAPK